MAQGLRILQQIMSTKLLLSKLSHELRELGFPPLRRAPLKPAMLYLMELRSHAAETHFGEAKLIIPVDMQDNSDIPHPVRITHLARCQAPSALALAH